MKYSKKDIVKVIANKNDLVIQEKNHLYINDLKINIEENDYIGLSYKNIIKTNSDKKEVSVWNNTNFLLLSKEHSTLNFIDNSLFILVDFDYENIYSLYKINVNKNIYHSKIDGFKNIIHFDSEKIWVNDMLEQNIIDCISIKNELIWQYTLPEGFTIFKQPQIVDNVLFFDSFKNGNEENFIVGLDIKTGEVLWQLLFKIPYKEQLLATTLHKENKLCYGYLGNLYQIFNPISGKIVLEKEMNKKINPYTNAIYDNKLWFVSGKYEECKFGYINLANNELELQQDFPQEDDETFEIVYHQKKLYLRGKYYNNLYIFEE